MCFAVELGVVTFSSTAAVETEETDIKAGGVIDAVEALCAVFAIDAL